MSHKTRIVQNSHANQAGAPDVGGLTLENENVFQSFQKCKKSSFQQTLSWFNETVWEMRPAEGRDATFLRLRFSSDFASHALMFTCNKNTIKAS